MTISKADFETRLSKYVVKRVSHPNVPASLDGEILLEEHRGVGGELLGVITVSIDAFLDLPVTEGGKAKRAGRGKRAADEKRDLESLNYDTLVEADPDDEQGYRRFFDKWKLEGLI